MRGVPVDAVTRRRHRGEAPGLLGASTRGRPGLFDFDHIGAEVGENHRTIRPRGKPGEIENGDAFERHGHRDSSPAWQRLLYSRNSHETRRFRPYLGHNARKMSRAYTPCLQAETSLR
jgi:hypothetical protein